MSIPEMITLPDEVDSDLGRPKVEEPIADLDRDFSGHELNRIKYWIKVFGQLFGPTDGSGDAASIFARLASGGGGGGAFALKFLCVVDCVASGTKSGVFFDGAVLDITPDNGYVVPNPGGLSIDGMWLQLFANDSLTSTTVTLYKNGVATAFTYTIAIGATGIKHVTGTLVTFSQGDVLTVFVTNTNGGAGKTVAFAPTFSCNPLSPVDPEAADATTTTHGMMSAADKVKLDGIATGATVTNDATVRAALAAATADIAVNAHKITGLADPTAAQDATTKAYVDAIAQGLSAKQSVRVATTANGTLATAFANGQTVDGVVLATGDRVLLKDQTTSADRGIYTVNASGAPTRATDWDASADLAKGAYVFVEEGTANADSGWVLTTDGVIVVGTTAIAFVQFSGAGQITAGTGLQKAGNTLSLTLTAALVISAMASAASALAMNAQKITGVADPTAAQDAATKKYVDTVVFTAVKTAAYTILAADRWILVDDTSGRVDLTMPALDGVSRIIQKVGGGTGGIRLIRSAAEKINTVAASYDLPGSTTAFASATPQAWTVCDNATDRFVV